MVFHMEEALAYGKTRWLYGHQSDATSGRTLGHEPAHVFTPSVQVSLPPGVSFGSKGVTFVSLKFTVTLNVDTLS